MGALLLTSLKGQALGVIVSAYLLLMGALIVWRGLRDYTPRLISPARRRLIGLAGGLIEGIGGSWGPIVTTSRRGSARRSTTCS